MIEIKEENKERIEKMISDAQGKSYERTVTFEDIVSAVDSLEKHYAKYTKKARHGLMLRVDLNAQPFPNAYKYRAKSTHILLAYKRGKWYLDEAGRCYTVAPKDRYVVMNMPKELLEEIIASEKRFEWS